MSHSESRVDGIEGTGAADIGGGVEEARTAVWARPRIWNTRQDHCIQHQLSFTWGVAKR